MSRVRGVVAFAVATAALPLGCAWSYGVVRGERDGTRVLKSEVAISHRDGVQRMIVALTLDAPPDEQLLWVFPLPAPASQSRVTALRSFPRFFGHDPCWGGRAWIHAFLLVSRATQLYPMLFEHIFLPDPVAKLPYYPNRFRGHRAGVQTSIVAADSPAALSRAAVERGFRTSPTALSPFEPWLLRREPTAFVMTTIAAGPCRGGDVAKSGPSRACVFVEFPSSHAALPVPPANVGATGSRDLVVYVMDYVQAQCSTETASAFESAYRYQSRFGPGVPDSFLAGLPREQAPVTVIRFTGPLSGLGHELRFRPAHPPGLAYAELVESLSLHMGHAWAARLALILALSYMGAGTAGLLLFHKWRQYAWLGILNLLTIVGMAVIVYRRRSHQPSFRTQTAVWQFCGLFSVVYVLLTILAGYLLLLPFRP